MEIPITLEDLKNSAIALRESVHYNGVPPLFCVDYGFSFSGIIHSKSFSTAEEAMTFAQAFGDDDYVSIYPVLDIRRENNDR